jgi:CDP-diacylglycerol--serine O-phosphatidyltransferase
MNLANLLTTLNLSSGLIAIFLGDPFWGGVFIIFGAIFDLFDGMAARGFGTEGKLGSQLDSLADLVTFGVAPASLYFGIRPEHLPDVFSILAGVLLVGSTAWRLALFNILPPSTTFRGLPSPASGLFFAAWLIGWSESEHWLYDLHYNSAFYLSLPIIFGTLMNIRAPFFSAKNFSTKWPQVLPYYLLGGITLVLFVWQPFLAAPLAILCYILLSLFFFPRTLPPKE